MHNHTPASLLIAGNPLQSKCQGINVDVPAKSTSVVLNYTRLGVKPSVGDVLNSPMVLPSVHLPSYLMQPSVM